MSSLSTAVISPEYIPFAVKERRALSDITGPLFEWSKKSPHLYHSILAPTLIEKQVYRIPRFVFIGPSGGTEFIRVGIFAGIHGDETAGPLAVLEFIQALLKRPEAATGYELYLYPICNPTGYEDGTRFSRSGRDLNREFWKESRQPEVRQLESQLIGLNFQGLISLHSDDTSAGLYGFARGSTLTSDVLEPALQAAESYLPRNYEKSIDNFEANRGIITQGYDGMLSAPPRAKPRPFEIVFETPHHSSLPLQIQATVAALESILAQYRIMISIGQYI